MDPMITALDQHRTPILRTAVWVVLAFLAASYFYAAVAQQWVGVPAAQQRPSAAANSLFSKRSAADPNAQMLVQANEIHYDYANERVSAVAACRSIISARCSTPIG